MTRFWFATFELQPRTDTPIGPIATTRYLAVEVLNDGDRWAVLFSSVDDLEAPRDIACLVGFTNVAKACNLWLDRGFPLVDADITHHAGTLRVVSPSFRADHPVMKYEEPLFEVAGIELRPAASHTRNGALETAYKQFFQTPDAVRPDQLVARMPQRWYPARREVRATRSTYLPAVDFDFGTLAARCPSLAPLDRGPTTPRAVWTGALDLPGPEKETPSHLKPEKVPPVFGSPSFRFEDVEIIGFRIDLRDLQVDFAPTLARLVAPLNFHLRSGTMTAEGRRLSPDFRYRAATSTIVIELLRYGRMKSRAPEPPLRIEDSQSQHELLVRLLVGRVDDDTAQAHDPAVFAPAIFVDNPWSKVLGRDAVGYDKRLATFCISEADGTPVPLLPDGRFARPLKGTGDDRGPAPLGAISSIGLVDQIGTVGADPLIEFSYSGVDHLDPAALLPIDLDLTFGASSLAGTRWRQSDFGDAEFGRSFAGLAIADSVRSFRSIQVAPIGRRGGLDPAWITGTFLLDPDIRASLPLHRATLTLYPRENRKHGDASAAPAAWNELCKLLAGVDPMAPGTATSRAIINVLPGSWYRLSCSMDLKIDDGLDWTPWLPASVRRGILARRPAANGPIRS